MNIPHRIQFGITLSVIFTLLICTQGTGPDQPSYDAWAQALLAGQLPGEIFAGEDIKAPTGLQYNRHYPGVAAFQLIPRLIFETVEGSSIGEFETKYVGAIILVFFLLVIWRCFRDFSSFEWTLVAALGLIATPVGLNILSTSSTAQSSLIPAALVIWELKSFTSGKKVSHARMALALALLFSIRAYLIIYPVFLSITILACQSERISPMDLCWYLFAMFVGGFIYCSNNFLMTGDPFVPIQDFGDAGFETLSLLEPKYVLSILISPHHGVFTTHPLMAALPMLGIANSVILYRRSRFSEMFVVVALSLAVLVHTYIQGCWYHWTLTIGFGNRAMVFPGIVCTFFAIQFLRLTNEKVKRIALVAIVSTLVFSFLLALGGTRTYYFSHWAQLVELKFAMLDWVGYGVFTGDDWIQSLELALRPILLICSFAFFYFLMRVDSDYDALPAYQKITFMISFCLVACYSIDRFLLVAWKIDFATKLMGALLLVSLIFYLIFRHFETKILSLEPVYSVLSLFSIGTITVFFSCYFLLHLNACSNVDLNFKQQVPQGAWRDALFHLSELRKLAKNNTRYQVQADALNSFIERKIGFLQDVPTENPLRTRFYILIEKLENRPTNISRLSILQHEYDGEARRRRQAYKLFR